MPKVGANSLIGDRYVLADLVEIGRNCVLSGEGRLDHGVVIGHNVVMDGSFEIGERCVIDHHATLLGHVRMGICNRIHSFSSIGDGPQHPELRQASGGVSIGNRNVIREFVSIYAPTIEKNTFIGDDCYLMVYCHVSHDCLVRNEVKMAIGATIAGHVTIGHGSYLGAHSVVHQRLTVGDHVMLGMNSAVVKHVPPCSVLFDQIIRKPNRVGLERKGFDQKVIQAIGRFFNTGLHDSFDSDNIALVRECIQFQKLFVGLPRYLLPFQRNVPR